MELNDINTVEGIVSKETIPSLFNLPQKVMNNTNIGL